MSKKYITKSEKGTFSLGNRFAGGLCGGEVIGLVGDLGSGKTVFTKGLAAGLGIEKHITSPTFVLLKPYDVQGGDIKKLIHIDAYRLGNGEELEAIGVSDFFNDAKCVTVIEWADRVKDAWPKGIKIIKFKACGGNKREIIIIAK